MDGRCYLRERTSSLNESFSSGIVVVIEEEYITILDVVCITAWEVACSGYTKNRPIIAVRFYDLKEIG
jgi:hypothetical protein